MNRFVLWWKRRQFIKNMAGKIGYCAVKITEGCPKQYTCSVMRDICEYYVKPEGCSYFKQVKDERGGGIR